MNSKLKTTVTTSLLLLSFGLFAQALEQLDPIQRQILWLAYVQGDSHDEIASVLGLRSISIRTLLLRARRKLAGILGENYRIRGSLESGS